MSLQDIVCIVEAIADKNASTVYDIMVPTGTNYFAFMALIGL